MSFDEVIMLLMDKVGREDSFEVNVSKLTVVDRTTIEDTLNDSGYSIDTNKSTIDTIVATRL